MLFYRGRQRILDSNGDPVPGALANFYLTTTSTRTDTYSDAALTIPLANPVPADGYGFLPPIYLDPGITYKCVITTAAAVSLPDGTVDPLINKIVATYYITTAERAASVTPVNYDIPSHLVCETVWIERYGNNTTPLTTNMAAALVAAQLVATASGKPIGSLYGVHISSATVVTSPWQDTLSQQFSATSQVTLSPFARPEWFGSAAGNIRLAVNALPSTGGTIRLEDKAYQPSYDTFTGSGSDVAGVDYLAKPSVTIIGTLPAWASNHQSYVVGSGSIIQGPFAVFATGFKIVGGLGIDSSLAVVNALYGGTAKDAFLFAQPNKTTPTYVADINIQAIYGVCKSAASTVHAVLLEGINGGYVGVAEGAFSYHGVVCKSQALNGSSWRGWGNGGECVIFKSESYAPMVSVQVANVACVGGGTGVTSWGCYIQALSAGARLEIGNLEAEQCSAGLQMSGTAASLSDISIASVITETCLSGVVIDGTVRTEIGALIANNSTNAVTITSATTSKTNRIGSVKATNVTGDVFNLSGQLRIGSVSADTVTGYVYNYVNSAARILIEGSEFLTSAANYWNLSTTRVNSWADFGSGNSAYNVRLGSGRVWLKGLIHSGSAATITTFSAQITPNENLRLTGNGYNGATYAPIEIVVGSGGVLSATNYTAGSTYVSLDGLSYAIPF